MNYDLRRRLVAEFVGTALLVVFGTGSVAAALRIDQAGIDFSALGFISLTFGIVVASVIYGFGAVSGAHINPAVTVTLAVTKRFSWSEVPSYLAAQLAGAVGGALLVVAMFGSATARRGEIGLTTLAPGVSPVAGVLAEAVGTFLLMFTVMAVAVNPQAPKGWAGLMIGLAVAAAILVVGPLTGGSFNPARTFGPYLVGAGFGAEPPWLDLGVYIVGPLAGSILAALVYGVVALRHTASSTSVDAGSE